MAVDRHDALLDVNAGCSILDNDRLNRIQSNEWAFFELNQFCSIGGASFSIHNQWRVKALLAFFLSLNYLWNCVPFLVFVISLQKQASRALREEPNEWDFKSRFLSNMAWNLSIHMNHDINPALMIRHHTACFSILWFLLFPFWAKVLRIVYVCVFFVNKETPHHHKINFSCENERVSYNRMQNSRIRFSFRMKNRNYPTNKPADDPRTPTNNPSDKHHRGQ